MTTIGQLVSILFAKYERQFHDEKLAAVELVLAQATSSSGIDVFMLSDEHSTAGDVLCLH